MTEKKGSSGKQSSPPAWEWLIAGVGAILIIGVISTMAYRGATGEDAPPSFEITVVSVTPSADGHVATFRIKNLGTQTAANLELEGSLRRGEQEVESSNANLTYVPGNSEREGGLFFKDDPAQFQLQIRATGYEKP